MMRTSVRQPLYHIVDFSLQIALQAVQVVHGGIGTAIDRRGLCSDKQLASIGREAVAVEGLERALACRGGVKQHFHGLPRLERVFDDLCTPGIHLRVVFPVARDGDNAVNVFGGELSRYDFFQFVGFHGWIDLLCLVNMVRFSMVMGKCKKKPGVCQP